MALLAIGYRSLSMSPASIGPVKAMLLSLDLGAPARRSCSRCSTAQDGCATIRPHLAAFAEEHGVPV